MAQYVAGFVPASGTAQALTRHHWPSVNRESLEPVIEQFVPVSSEKRCVSQGSRRVQSQRHAGLLRSARSALQDKYTNPLPHLQSLAKDKL